MQCEVLRPFTAIDHELAIGTQVDTAAWRPEAVRSLIERRFLRPLDLPAVAQMTTAIDILAAPPREQRRGGLPHG